MKSSDIINAGKAVLSQEIKGLEALHSMLGETFVQTVELISTLKGRVIITGMGKSGHIARKIAATLASTGTPASFVHPGEASHGDLGMITKDDAVIVLSNSGETTELGDIIHYTTRFNIPLIAMVRRESSQLVDASTIALVLPEIPEASTTKAPTTSTTMMLALGDAIAIALAEQKGFSADDFNIFHPGGKLGSQFMAIERLMHRGESLPRVSHNAPMSDVLLEITSKSFGCTCVTDDSDTLIGIITDGDLRRHMDSNLLDLTAEQVMTVNPVTIPHTALATQALNIMETKSITALFSVNAEHKPVGIVHIHDLLRAGVS